jgi:molybdopterin converting factor small subunit
MAIEIRIPAALRRYTGGARRIAAAGATLDAVLHDAVRQHPDLKDRLFTAAGGLRSDARVFIGSADPGEDPLAAQVREGEPVTILPPIAGA